jgi:DNA-binding beta-propeller fold protein YncE
MISAAVAMREAVMRCFHRIFVAASLSIAAFPPVAAASVVPTFAPDVGWLHLPAGLATGEISAVAVDRHDNVWILQRPGTVDAAERAHAAPPVMKFDRSGRYVAGFGGPGAGYDWPTTEHSLALDKRDHVWITGSFRGDAAHADDMLLEFTDKGRFVKQIGRVGGSKGDADTRNLHAPADVFVDDEANEVYVADGYGNRRVIVFDADSGVFKRMWSAFGAPPPIDPPPAIRQADAPFTPEEGDGPRGFNGVHGVEIARDGLVYVSDRNNQRIQVFDRTGRYIRQVFVDRNMPSPQTASGIAFSADRAQRYMYVADWGNARLLIYDRASLALLGSLGGKGTTPGQFLGPHLIATDSKGVLYVAEVAGRRVQRFIPRPRPAD